MRPRRRGSSGAIIGTDGRWVEGLPRSRTVREVLPMADRATSPGSPASPIPASVRYLGNIADLSGAFHQARVRFPGNPGAAICWIARQLGHALPMSDSGSIATHVLHTGSGWRPVDDRPGLSALEQGRSAQRLADRGILVIAVHCARSGTPEGIALVAPGGMTLVPRRPSARRKASGHETGSSMRPMPRIEDFRIRDLNSTPMPTAGRWSYRQAPGWASAVKG